MTTPLSKDTKVRMGFNYFMSPFDLNKISDKNGLSVPSLTQGSISNFSNNNAKIRVEDLPSKIELISS